MLPWSHESLSPWCFGWHCLPCFVPKSSWCVKGTTGSLWGSFSSRCPDFQCGHPAYFDLSGCSTIQPSYVSSASSCAGLTAAAGDLAKDLRHQDAVEEAECDFFLLVVEAFGAWSPFALQMLRTIANRIIARSGASTKLARKHLLQQLSASIWPNNAWMTLRYWALQVEDNDFPIVTAVVITHTVSKCHSWFFVLCPICVPVIYSVLYYFILKVSFSKKYLWYWNEIGSCLRCDTLCLIL